ncbi:IS30 family transposase [Pullulanibacillus camelliae]|uniref:IS30 family transposase n=1 Tax=Pullulanibacillus camelliae TaxID=1707096 RepID=A0A8J2YDW0_9BACL|nr:IS30 family transposase [Pullulanibacillus camelliae]
MEYSHLSTFERGRLDALHQLGKSCREIAKELNRHHSTIARELKRNKAENESYSPEKAQAAYHERRTHSRPHGKWNEEIAQEIEEKLELTWSPEQIAGRLKASMPSFKPIYRWLYKGRISKGNLTVLRQKGKRRRPRETRGRFNIGRSIKQRPKEIRKREQFGHWELDTVVSSRGQSKGCMATFAERKIRFYLAIKILNRTAQSMKEALTQVVTKLPKGTFETATVDRGKEFALHKEIETHLDVSVYFADPYSSWQRGTNENANGLLREFFPKASDLSKVTQRY